MPELKKAFQKAESLIKKHEKILIISHRNPDADTIGANLALKHVLENNFNKKVASACGDPMPGSLLFLTEKDKIHQKVDLSQYNLLIAVDASNTEQLKFKLNNLPLLNIDHHATNKKYGTENIVVPEAASTTEIVYLFFEYLGVKTTPFMATCLLAGIYTDTGSFMHSNTSAETYQVAAKLVEAGGSFNQVVDELFKRNTVEQLKLWGKVLSNTRLSKNGTVASKVTERDFNETKTSPHDLTGVINYLNSVEGSNMSILLSEDMKGNVKGSVRSGRDRINVGDICEQLGGGGHKKAAGFSIPGKIVSEEVWRIED